MPTLLEQLQNQKIDDYELWQGVFLPSIKASINAAHKQIVRYAQLAEWSEVAIAEDDLIFTSPNSWRYYIDKMPLDFSIYLSMVYLGEIYDGDKVRNWTGLTLYTVHHSFYETFLSVPDDDHLDILLSQTDGVFVVCNPFVAKQSNGFSSNTGKDENYDDLLRNRIFL